MKNKLPHWHSETLAIHNREQQHASNYPVAPPIMQTATFAISSLGDSHDNEKVYAYTRYSNPTFTECENTIAQLEKTEAALIFPSGMAAITCSILALVKQGDHIIAQSNHYWNTQRFLHHWLPNYGITTTFVETNNIEAIANAIQPNTRLLVLESPTNPLMKLVDLSTVVNLAKTKGLITLLDNTLCSPVNQNPGDFGIDIVLHSATKYLAGHSDLLAGAVAGAEKFIKQIHETRTILGMVMDPHAAWLLLRGIRTLYVRVQQHNANALKIAEFLQAHPAVNKVNYPFLKNHPQFELAKKQMRGGGAVISFEIKGSIEQAKQVINALRLFAIAGSLGGVESLVTLPILATDKQQSLGISDQLIRISVGIENVQDLIDDLAQALKQILI